MTKKEELVWRLGKLPTVEEITTLIANKIITQDEAREILFNKKIEEERDIKSLETEIKFLRDLVEKLSQGRNQIVEVIKEVVKPFYIKEPWYQPYYYWCNGSSSITLGVSGTATNLSNAINCTSNTLQVNSTPTNCSFSSIQTW
jgi:hypothetical protein